MKAVNKLTIPHQDHEVVVKRADPKSPHYGFYHCATCNKFVTWIDKRTYMIEKNQQKRENIMWFGKHQGEPLSQLPQEYLEWAILNLNGTKSELRRLDEEYLRRQSNR